jgi:hypothetical protein
MAQRFTNRQIVTIVACICIAIMATPVIVWAATSVNIADPNNSARVAQVTAARALQVETRAGVRGNAFNLTGSRLGLGYINLISTTAPTKLAITELTLMGQGSAGQQEALIEAFVRTSGSNGCSGPGTAGYTRFTMRRVAFDNEGTLQVLFNGPPMYLPSGASGQPTCFGVTVISIPSGSGTYVGGTGYRYVD